MGSVHADQVRVGDRVMTDQTVERLEVIEVRREGALTRVRTTVGWNLFDSRESVEIEQRSI